MHLVLFPPPSSLQPSCKCRCSPQKRSKYTFTNTNYAPETHTYFCLPDTHSQIPNTPATPAWSRSRCNCRCSPVAGPAHVRLSNVSALSQLLRFLRLFKTDSLQLPSLGAEQNFATKVFGLRSERVKVRELFHQQSAERRPFLER